MKSSTEVWKVDKSFQGTNQSYSIGRIKDLHGLLLTDDILKANALNSYFTNIYSTLNNNTVPHLPPFTNYIYRVTPTLQPLFVNRELVSNCANHHLKECKACRPDNKRGRELRLIWDDFIDSFFIMAREGFADRKFPQQWITAQVKCTHKEGSQLDCDNYRPISLLSQPSKLLESLVCKQLDFFLEHYNLLHNSRWSFTKGTSTLHDREMKIRPKSEEICWCHLYRFPNSL